MSTQIVPKSLPGRRLLIPAVLALAPLLAGGCPEFRDDAVDIFETAARSLLDAALDNWFDQFRSDSTF